jgi:hypothetical protein
MTLPLLPIPTFRELSESGPRRNWGDALVAPSGETVGAIHAATYFLEHRRVSPVVVPVGKLVALRAVSRARMR